MSDLSDLRQHPRVVTSLEARVGSDVDLDLTDAMMSNLSLGGAFLVTSHAAGKDSIVRVRFDPGDGGPAIDVVGRVAWVKAASGPGAPPGMGVQFVQVSGQDLARLKRMMQALMDRKLFA
jgi:Tfp pilus assembly protein PilZ